MTRNDPERARRLAEALRQNLRLRKAQAREGAAEARQEGAAGGPDRPEGR